MKAFLMSTPDRRPIKTRSAWWARAFAAGLLKLGVTPNQVSLASIVFALLGAALFVYERTAAAPAWPYLCIALLIQLRLLANLLDGLIAVEGGRMSKTGELYNEIPDRVADVAFLAAAGYASHFGEWGVGLGWGASVLAVAAAYIRALGARRGQPQDFCGPQAKPHRMFLLTMACLCAFAENLLRLPPVSLFGFLILINIGTLITCVRRTIHLARQMEAA